MKHLKIIGLWVVLTAMTACSPCRHLMTSNNTQDSVRVETVVRYERVPDTVFIEIPVEVERQTVRDSTSHLETSFAVSDARINTDGGLYHSLENKPQKRPVEAKKEVIYRDSIVYRDRAVTETRIKEIPRELTWWQQTQIRGFWVAIVVVLVLLRKKILLLIRRFI